MRRTVKVKRKWSVLTLSIIVVVLVIVASSLAQESEIPKFEVDEIIQYKALPSYGESPELAEAVKRGEIPPVEERLPAKPAVVMTWNVRRSVLWRRLEDCLQYNSWVELGCKE